MSNTLQQLILKFPDKPWNWWELSRNPNITMKFVLDNINKPWNWQWLSQNKFLLDPILMKLKEKQKQKIKNIFKNRSTLIRNTKYTLVKFLVNHTINNI